MPVSSYSRSSFGRPAPAVITPAFTPAALAGLSLWLDASDADTLTLASGDVAVWADKSGNGNHATGAVGTRPSLIEGSQNGLPIVRFASEFLTIPSAELYSNTDGFTILAVATQPSPNPALIGKYHAASNKREFALGMSAGNLLWRTTSNPASTSAAQDATLTGGFTGYKLITARWNPGVASGVSIGGTEATASAAAASMTPTDAAIEIGRYNLTSTNDFSLAELVVVADYLDGDALTEIQGYLQAKWFAPERVAIVDDGRHNAFPGFTVTLGGRYLVTYRDGPTHGTSSSTTLADRGVIRQRTSDDQGATWSASAVVQDSGNIDSRDPAMRRLRDGSIALSYFVSGTGVFFRKSIDDGATYAAAVNVTSGLYAGSSVGACSAPVTELSNGDLLMPVYGKLGVDDTKNTILAVRSSDGGATWGDAETVVAGGTVGENWSEPYIERLDGDRLVCLIRGATSAYVSWSDDNGYTWSEPVEAYVGGGRPALLNLTDGVLLVVYRTAVGALYRTSTDEGATWSEATVMDTATSQGTYAQAMQVAPGTVAVAYALEESDTESSVYMGWLTGLAN